MSATMSATNEQVADYNRNPKFERRVVVFYDVLGWRGITENTAGLPDRIGDLRRLILLHTRVLNLPTEEMVNVSTFSDNVVVSAGLDVDTRNVLLNIAVMQMMTQSRGFFLRGGVTVGDIHHDDESVFGPGLNRAYDIERKIAIHPRIVLDPAVMKLGDFSDFTSTENAVTFLDTHRKEFLDYITGIWNIPGPDGKRMKAADVWKADYEKFVPVLVSPLPKREYVKVAWLIDRIAKHAAFAPSSAYARQRPPREPLSNYVRAALSFFTQEFQHLCSKLCSRVAF